MSACFLLCDLETGGLDPEVHPILEFAGILIRPPGINIQSQLHVLIYHEGEISPEAREMHEASGLLRELEEGATSSLPTAQKRIMGWIDDNVSPDDDLFLMGSSIHFDRSFIKKHMPEFDARLHYRMLDVRSLWLWRWLVTGHNPDEIRHRAMDDCHRTLEFAMALGRVL